MDEIFGLHGKLVGLRNKFFREEERAMVHVIPWVFQGDQSFKYLLIIVEATKKQVWWTFIGDGDELVKQTKHHVNGHGV